MFHLRPTSGDGRSTDAGAGAIITSNVSSEAAPIQNTKRNDRDASPQGRTKWRRCATPCHGARRKSIQLIYVSRTEPVSSFADLPACWNRCKISPEGIRLRRFPRDIRVGCKSFALLAGAVFVVALVVIYALPGSYSGRSKY
jgi:hypothetical protein